MDCAQILKKFSLREGDVVEVVTDDSAQYSGTIIPSADSGALTLKLPSGYNVGIGAEKIKSARKISSGKIVAKPAAIEIKRNPELPTIAILHTGGTLASRVNYSTGGVYAAFSPEDLITMFPELAQIANFEARLVSNIMSEDMRFSDYKKIAGAVADEIRRGVRGIIIGHGTDMLAYTSAALSFILENLPIPVILVGAQRSSDRGSSDAAMNLICAAEFIAKTDFAGVAICMHDASDDGCCAILPATKTRKMHTSRRDAFKAINDTAIARVNYKTREIAFLKKDYAKRGPKAKLELRDKFEDAVGMIKIRPNMHADEFLFFRNKKYKGLIIEATGLGHMPVGVAEENIKIRKGVQSLIKSGCVVAIASQCLYGRVHPAVYTNLRILSEMGVVFCEDMLPETAFIKLAWLLGNYKKKEAEQLIARNLRGEITERTELETFDLE